jgi:hypothetical protein
MKERKKHMKKEGPGEEKLKSKKGAIKVLTRVVAA